MATAFLSQDWYRVADLRLRRHGDVTTARHVYRGEVWHVLQNPQSGKMHRLTDAAHAFFARLDGRRSVQDVWLRCCALFPDRPPSQTEILNLLAQLHAGDLILGDRLPNLTEIDCRTREEDRRTLLAYVKNPLSLRFPLFDPEPFLRWSAPVARLVFSPFGAVVWLVLIGAALAGAILNREALALPGMDQIATAGNLAYLAVAYLVVKALHELGHGYAVKRWGGEVHEFGVMMLVFFPVPYVDASQATFFPGKGPRMIVSAAGILVELAVAAAAFLVWLAADPGPVRTLAYNLTLIGGISTLLFNGNPLLRFDGYFVFADLMESPNLGQRSNQFFWHLVRRVLLRDRDAPPPLVAPREGGLLLVYAVGSFLYRMSVLLFISIYLTLAMPVIGAALALWSLFTVLILPAFKALRYLVADPALDLVRARVLARAALLLVLGFGAVFVLPVPHVTTVDAVLDPAEGSLLRVMGSGFVERVLVADGQAIKPGQPVLELSDPFLSLERRLALAERDDARARLGGLPLADRNGRKLWQEQLGFSEARLADLSRREAMLVLRAEVAGHVHVPEAASLPGRFLQQGEVPATVLAPGPSRWRVAIPAADAGPVDAGSRRIELAPRLGRPLVYRARILARAPEVTTALPSFALTTKAGGGLLVDPAAESPISLTPVVNYLLTVETDPAVTLPGGARARVRFVHDPSPIGPRLWRALTQTFLRQFGS